MPSGRLSCLALHLVSVLFSTFVGVGTARLRIPINHQFVRQYTYTSQSGQDWESGKCRFGRLQSPIDFPKELPKAAGTFKYRYGMHFGNLELSNSRNVYLLDLMGQGFGGIMYQDVYYSLLTITVHAWSEHTVGGEHLPAELHLVHKNARSAQLIVVAVPLNSEAVPVTGGAVPVVPAPANFNPALQPFLTRPPGVEQKTNVIVDHQWNLNSLLGDGDFLTYSGSLTKPPCVEIVTWLVKAEPVLISDGQAQQLHNIIYSMAGNVGNARSTMPLNGRVIGAIKAVLEAEEPAVPSADRTAYATPPTDREIIVRQWTEDALKITQDATATVAKLNSHVVNAAEAEVKTLAMPLPLAAAPGPGPAPAPASA